MDNGGDGGGSSKSPPEKEEEEEPEPPVVMVQESDCFSHVRLTDAPILLFVYFHEAFRKETAGLRRLAVRASECGPNQQRELVVELRRRFDFLKLAYKYHTATEDEVIFLALDAHVKNIVRAYSLEHESIDKLFDTVFHWLNGLEESKNDPKPFQELVTSIGTMQSFISEHMLKEEKQVFSLFMEQFSPTEQASIVWQFICSVPVIVLEDLLPWIYSFLRSEKQVEAVHCIRQIVPNDESLQEVVISWLLKNDKSGSGPFIKIRERDQDVSTNKESVPHLYSSKMDSEQNQPWKKFCTETTIGKSLVDCLNIWHGAIQRDLDEILEELYQMKSLNSFLAVDFVVFRLKFLADVIIFHSDALKKSIFPVLNELASNHFSPSGEHPLIESYIESLHKLLYYNDQNGLPLSKFVEMLCQEIESLVMNISKLFHFQQIEVFPIMSKKRIHEAQQQLLYMTLHVMPLGLLKCTITWLAVRLSKIEFRFILQILSLGDDSASKYFESLLLEWFHIGYSGKSSIENFGEELKKMYKSQYPNLPEKVKDTVSLPLNMQPCKESKSSKIEPVSVKEGNKILRYSSSSGPHGGNACERSYASEINLHILFPGTVRSFHPFLKLTCGESSASSTINQPIPVDLIFFFHKALVKDLECLVLGSAHLVENIGSLTEFQQHFKLFHFRYQFHSDVEDEIAFPALEANENVQNISQSYTIDHELQVKYFSDIFQLLDGMSKLHMSASTDDSKKQDWIMAKFNELCAELHDTCKSLHELLFDHVEREEIELWSLFRKYFSIQEQEKIIGRMLGRVKAETLQDMIPWLLGSLTPEEQHTMMSLLRMVTKNTMFDEWLREWWEGYDVPHVSEETVTSCAADPLEIISGYLSKDALDKQGDILHDAGIEFSQEESLGAKTEKQGRESLDDKANLLHGDQNDDDCLGSKKFLSHGNKRLDEVADATNNIDKTDQLFQLSVNSRYHARLLTVSQDDIEAAIIRVSRDTSLDSQKKSYVIQSLLMSRWILHQQISNTEATISSIGEEISGQHPSYQEPLKQILGCKHYKRKCKLVMPCCNKLYTCIRCHEEVADHSTDRRAIRKMMCMKCLVIQPIGETCSTVSCDNLSMGRYYCRICKLFDDDREIYHCPYCNLCRVGKGLGTAYFHCMNCNGCMSKSLSAHVCREKSFLEENCPICHEYIFTSSNPVKALPCGHSMHSTCFRDYTCTHYTCPICSKSLGDMQAYFKMLDALLAEEKIPDEYSGKTQLILCNDCEKKGAATFHWVYHKCPYCGSYNTRLL